MTAATVLFVLLTIGAYALSRAVSKRWRSPFTTPVFSSTSLIVLVLVAGGVPYADYTGASFGAPSCRRSRESPRAWS